MSKQFHFKQVGLYGLVNIQYTYLIVHFGRITTCQCDGAEYICFIFIFYEDILIYEDNTQRKIELYLYQNPYPIDVNKTQSFG